MASSGEEQLVTLPKMGSNPLDANMKEVLLSHEEIQARVRSVAAQVSKDLAGQDVIVVGVLTGAFMFTTDLVKHLTIPAEVKFVRASSYGTGTESSGEVTIATDLLSPEEVEGRTVLLVEDIIDTGTTLSHLRGYLLGLQPGALRICCLLDKPARRTAAVEVDYTAFTVPDEFVVGYGLDYAEQYRCLPYIGVLKPEVYGA